MPGCPPRSRGTGRRIGSSQQLCNRRIRRLHGARQAGAFRCFRCVERRGMSQSGKDFGRRPWRRRRGHSGRRPKSCNGGNRDEGTYAMRQATELPLMISADSGLAATSHSFPSNAAEATLFAGRSTGLRIRRRSTAGGRRSSGRPSGISSRRSWDRGRTLACLDSSPARAPGAVRQGSGFRKPRAILPAKALGVLAWRVDRRVDGLHRPHHQRDRKGDAE
jgi:hypothetical protein